MNHATYIMALVLTAVHLDKAKRQIDKLKDENEKLKRKCNRKHLMFKLATEDFNDAMQLLTTEEREQIMAKFNAREEFLNSVQSAF